MARPREFNQDEVLQRAMMLFWRKGFEATSMADMLEATGLSRSSLYDTFGDKRTLFLAAMDAYRRHRQERLQAMLNDGGPARQSIAGFFKSILSHALGEERQYGCMSCNEAVELAPRDEEVQRLVVADFKGVEDAFADAITRGQKDGSIANQEDSRKLARFLSVSLQGLQVMARAGVERENIADAMGVMLASLDTKTKDIVAH